MANTKELTIVPELLAMWQKSRRTGDSEKIAAIAGCKRLIVDRALKFGNVKTDRLRDVITNYFIDRITHERSQADLLRTLNEQL